MDKTQCKMARAALGWRAADLADSSAVHRVTVARFENGETVDATTALALREAFEAKGISFDARDGRIIVSAPAQSMGDSLQERRRALADAGRAVSKVKKLIAEQAKAK